MQIKKCKKNNPPAESATSSADSLTVSVQSAPCPVKSHASIFVRRLKIPNTTGNHSFPVWTHVNTAHAVGMGSAALAACCALPRAGAEKSGLDCAHSFNLCGERLPGSSKGKQRVWDNYLPCRTLLRPLTRVPHSGFYYHYSTK